MKPSRIQRTAGAGWLAWALAAGIGLSGCASKPLEPADCAKTDWQAQGSRAVSRGSPVDTAWQSSNGAECAAKGWGADRIAFDRGYASGINAYCSPRNGFALGRSDRRYQGICPSVLADEFQRAYDLGRVLHRADNDKSSAESGLNRARSVAADEKRPVKEREDARRDVSVYQTSRDNAQARITSIEAVAAQQGWGLGR